MDGTLNFDGKKYISAKRAAKIFGYASDYIGQLCRAKKVNARLVGRSWYVLEKDLIDHKNNPHLSLVEIKNNKKSQIIQKEEKYPKKSKSIKKSPSKNLIFPVDKVSESIKNEKVKTLSNKGVIEQKNQYKNKGKNSTENEKSRIAELGTKKALYIKDKEPLFPIIVKKFDANAAKFIAFKSINEALKKPKTKSDFEKFVGDMAMISLILLVVGTFTFGKENITNLIPNHFGSRVNEELSFLYGPYLNNFQNGYSRFEKSISNINKNNGQLASSLFSIDSWNSITGWIKDTAYKIIRPWLQKDGGTVIVENNNTTINNSSGPTENNPPNPPYINGGTGQALTTYISGVGKDYVDTQIAELKKYFLTLPSISPTFPNVNRYYITNQNDSIINNVGSSIRDSIANISGSTITKSTFSGSSVSAGSGSFTSLSAGSATFTGSTTVSDLISQNYLSVGTTTRYDTLTLGGALFLASLSSVPTDTSSRLYNTNNGDLYWAGNLIGGSTVGNWTTNGTDVWRAGGNVGIGSSTPSYKLSVSGSGYFDGTITTSSFIATSTTATSTISTGGLAIGGSQFVVQQNSGNVGIGTTNPGAKLDVASKLLMSAPGIAHPITTVLPTNGFLQMAYRSPTEGGLDLYGVTAGGIANPIVISGVFGSTDPTDAVPGIALRAGKSDGGTYWQALGSSETVLQIRNFVTNLVTVLGNGNVGIGTTSPMAKLSVKGGGTTTGLLMQLTDSADLAKVTVLDNGNVGIGTTSPSNKLYVNGNVELMSGTTHPNVGYYVVDAGVDAYGGGGIYPDSRFGTNAPNGDLSTNLSFNSGSWVSDNGSYGSMLFRLHTDNVAESSFQFYSGSPGAPTALHEIMSLSYNADSYINTGGNLGIGTTSPFAKLSVAGDGFFNGNLTAANIVATGTLTVRGATSDIAGTLNLSGGVLTSTAGLSLTSGGAGDLTFDSGSGTINIASGDDILATGANSNIGSMSTKFNTIYADTISATTLVGVVVGGATNAADWVINNDNVSNDTETMTLAFERGNVTPNALLTWNSDNAAKRFEFNQPLFIQGSTTIPTLDLKGVAGQTANLFRVASSSGDNFFNITSSGNVGIGSTTPGYKLSVAGSGYFDGGTVTMANLIATSTTATSTISGGLVISTNKFVVDYFTGNVGVATTSPVAGFAVGTHCVTGDTKLRRRKKKGDKYEYDEVMIKDVQEGDEIQSLDERTGKLVWSKVNKLMYMGEKEIYKITTASGKTIRTTSEHPYLVAPKNLTKTNPDLVSGVALLKPIIANKTKDRTFAFIDASNIYYGTKEAGWKIDFAKLKSYLISRFGVSRIFYFGAIDETEKSDIKLQKELISLGYELMLVTLKKFRNGKKKADTDSRMTFEMMKIKDEYDKTVVLTGDGDFFWVLDYLKEVKEKIWLLGMAGRTARELTKLFGPSFIHLGNVRKSIEKTGEKETDATFASVSGVPISYQNTLPFVKGGVWTKVKDLKEGEYIAVANDSAVWDKIIKIEKMPAEDVYDIEVEGTHNFVGNDIIAHNTYLGGNLTVQGTTNLLGTLNMSGNGLFTSSYSSSTAYSSFITASTTNLIINNQSFNNLLGSGLTNSGGALGIANNGVTGAMLALGSDATGDIMYYNGTDYVRLPATTNGFTLALSGGIPTWLATTTLTNISGTLAIASGGTNATSFANNTLISFDGTRFVSTSTPTFGNFNATSTTMASTIGAGGLTMSGNIAMGGNNISGGGTITATTFSGALTGNASTATKLFATKNINGIAFDGSADITVPVNNVSDATNADYFPLFTSTQGGNYAALTSTGLKYHPSTGILTATGFSGPITGAVTLSGVAINSILSTNSAGLIVATSTPTFGNFNATSTVATSTISTGGLTVGTNQFVIQQNSGNIGMGIATPSAQLQILGSNILNTTQTLNVSGSSGIGLVVTNAGNVGIGTTSPGVKLEVSSNDASAIRIAGNLGTGGANRDAQLLLRNYSVDMASIGWDLTGHTLNFSVNGVGTITPGDASAGTAMVIQETTGNVGIGTTEPVSKLDVRGVITEGNGTIQTVLSYLTGNMGGVVGTVSAHPFIIYSGNTEKVRILTDGNVGIGTTSPMAKLSVKGGGTTTGLLMQLTDSADLAKVTVLDNGNVGIGTTSPWGKLAIVQSSNNQAGGLVLSPTPQSTNSYRSLWMATDGTLSFQSTSTTATLTTNGTWTDASDRAYKYNIVDLRYGLATAMQLEPRQFNYKANGQAGLGFIAQELKNTVPEVVYGVDGAMTVDYGSLSAVALNAIKQIGGAVDVLDALSGTSTLKSSYKGVNLPAITVDAYGNASFFGQVTASGFNLASVGASLANLNQISSSTSLTLESLATSLNILTSSFASTTASIAFISSTTNKLAFDFADLSDRLKVLENVPTVTVGTSTDISSLFSNPEGLIIEAPLTLRAGLMVDHISSVSDYLSLISDTEFIGRPYFTRDTAGFAVVKAGSREVEIIFDREYLEQPIVGTTISFEAASSTSSEQAATSSIPVGGNNIEEQIFSNDVRFLVTNKSEKGFTILLNKPAPTDVPFSWTALAVKSAKVFSSIPPAPASIPRTITTIPAVVPEVAGAATTTSGEVSSSTPGNLGTGATSTATSASGSSTPEIISASGTASTTPGVVSSELSP